MHESAPALLLSVLRQPLRASSTSKLLQLSLVSYMLAHAPSSRRASYRKYV